MTYWLCLVFLSSILCKDSLINFYNYIFPESTKSLTCWILVTNFVFYYLKCVCIFVVWLCKEVNSYFIVVVVFISCSWRYIDYCFDFAKSSFIFLRLEDISLKILIFFASTYRVQLFKLYWKSSIFVEI